MKGIKIDWQILVPVILLFSLGLIIIGSVAPSLALTQLVFGLIAFGVFIIVSSLDYRLIFSLHLPIFISILFLTLIPFILNSVSRGVSRWIYLGNFTFQPSEIIKPVVIMSFSVLFFSHLRYRHLLSILVTLIPLTIIFLQPDLGTFLVLFSGIIVILFSKYRLLYILGISSLLALLVFPTTQYLLRDYQKQRLFTFINPYSDPLGNGYHVIQSVISVGSGQLLGRGLGQGTQSQLRFLPEHHTDFIFASLSEELGFVGGIIVLALFLLLFYRVFRISQSVNEPSGAAYSLAALTMLSFQTFVNIGMNLGLVPITGITLPFLSYGGSSLLSMAVTLGLISSISRYHKPQSVYQIS
jgi:rod shape determining protein RodA